MRTSISKKINPALAQEIKRALKACTSCEAQNTCDVVVMKCGAPNFAVLDVEPREGASITGTIIEEIKEHLTDEGVKVDAWNYTPRYGILFVEQLTTEGNR